MAAPSSSSMAITPISPSTSAAYSSFMATASTAMSATSSALSSIDATLADREARPDFDTITQSYLEKVYKLCPMYWDVTPAEDPNEAFHTASHLIIPELQQIRVDLMRHVSGKARALQSVSVDAERIATTAHRLSEQARTLVKQSQVLTTRAREVVGERARLMAKEVQRQARENPSVTALPQSLIATVERIMGSSDETERLTNEAEVLMIQAMQIATDAEAASVEAARLAHLGMDGGNELKNAADILDALEDFIAQLDGMVQVMCIGGAVTVQE